MPRFKEVEDLTDGPMGYIFGFTRAFTVKIFEETGYVRVRRQVFGIGKET